MYEIIKINSNTWRIEDSGVRFFLLEGKNEALLIDTGMNTPNAKEIAKSITNLPLKLLNTHADPDHISGNENFEEFYMDENESENYLSHSGKGKIVPVHDGDIIDLGERQLKIISMHGHTPGSIAVLDIAGRVLFGGDPIQDGRIFMFGERRDMNLYFRSLVKLRENHSDEFDTVYPSHGTFPVSPKIIEKLIEAAESIISLSADGKKVSFMGNEITVYDFGFATFLCD